MFPNTRQDHRIAWRGQLSLRTLLLLVTAFAIYFFLLAGHARRNPDRFPAAYVTHVATLVSLCAIAGLMSAYNSPKDKIAACVGAFVLFAFTFQAARYVGGFHGQSVAGVWMSAASLIHGAILGLAIRRLAQGSWIGIAGVCFFVANVVIMKKFGY